MVGRTGGWRKQQLDCSAAVNKRFRRPALSRPGVLPRPLPATPSHRIALARFVVMCWHRVCIRVVLHMCKFVMWKCYLVLSNPFETWQTTPPSMHTHCHTRSPARSRALALAFLHVRALALAFLRARSPHKTECSINGQGTNSAAGLRDKRSCQGEDWFQPDVAARDETISARSLSSLYEARDGRRARRGYA
jgi:hypothetical protein